MRVTSAGVPFLIKLRIKRIKNRLGEAQFSPVARPTDRRTKLGDSSRDFLGNAAVTIRHANECKLMLRGARLRMTKSLRQREICYAVSGGPTSTKHRISPFTAATLVLLGQGEILGQTRGGRCWRNCGDLSEQCFDEQAVN